MLRPSSIGFVMILVPLSSGALAQHKVCIGCAPTTCISSIRTDGLGLAMILGALMSNDLGLNSSDSVTVANRSENRDLYDCSLATDRTPPA